MIAAQRVRFGSPGSTRGSLIPCQVQRRVHISKALLESRLLQGYLATMGQKVCAVRLMFRCLAIVFL